MACGCPVYGQCSLGWTVLRWIYGLAFVCVGCPVGCGLPPRGVAPRSASRTMAGDSPHSVDRRQSLTHSPNYGLDALPSVLAVPEALPELGAGSSHDSLHCYPRILGGYPH